VFDVLREPEKTEQLVVLSFDAKGIDPDRSTTVNLSKSISFARLQKIRTQFRN